MKKLSSELIFISQINRDGSGTTPVDEEYLKFLLENKFSKNNKYRMQCLSMTQGTYIASNFNSFVVKLK